MLSFITPQFHGYSVKFSPFFLNRVAVGACEKFGFTGGGALFVLEIKDGVIVEKNNKKWATSVFDIAWCDSNENVLVSACGDGSLQVWNLLHHINQPILTLKEHCLEISSVEWDHNCILSASWDGSIKLWNIHSQHSFVTFVLPGQIIHQAVCSPHISSHIASVSQDGNLRIWDQQISHPSLEFKVHEGECLTCSWSPNNANIIASGGTDCMIKIWDLRNFKHVLCQLVGCEYPIKKIKHSPHQASSIASISYDLTTSIWDYEQSSQPVETFKHHSELVYGLDFNKFVTGQIVDCGWDSLVHVFSSKYLLNQELQESSVEKIGT